MTDPRLTPDDERFYTTAPITVVYDVFAETANRLTGRYVHLAEHAATEAEHEDWKAKIFDLRDERRAVDPDDKDALIAHIRRWRAETDALESRR
ncbi:hypothetical protein ACFPZ0_04120 [Streptomonospora nanhaiensis]|uniref:Uncharacterized protein n=1 Tax=Streptomonospora nanhaiensis TaxID=1323731 RepID=A0A853BS21_9ACTN|nr:hypothetical protein [Streptomonospora nanhaiensis]MBV2362201.1 hypothetical protein [Streptomonospora nanhaiensis]MBX9388151.1 hypothetical protein [Streptomonospora nanhaiensis]NYI97347.1 hypothetical protein [Streptomonospora nanhaiensis]